VVYTGNWADGMMQGEGTMTLSDRSTITGTWDRDMPVEVEDNHRVAKRQRI
jgi:hypothetical protein